MPASQPNLQRPTTRSVRLYGWRHPAILTAAGLAVAAGFAQFGVTTTLADVAKAFGQPGSDGSVTAQVGLSFTTLGLGLGIIRLAAVGYGTGAGLTTIIRGAAGEALSFRGLFALLLIPLVALPLLGRRLEE